MKTNSTLTPQLLETIERYDNGTMSPQERTHFESQLQNDPDFNALVEDVRALLLGIETQALKERLDNYHEAIPKHNPLLPTPVKARLFNMGKIAIAAGLILAIGLVWYMGQSSNQRLYSKYFVPDPGLPTTMSTSDNFVFYDAMVNYKQAEYETAISKWEQLAHKTPQNDTINYFLGVAHLANKNTGKAIGYLTKTTNSTQSAFLDDAYYYLGLAYLKSDKTTEAIQAFQNSNTENANKILNKLR